MWKFAALWRLMRKRIVVSLICSHAFGLNLLARWRDFQARDLSLPKQILRVRAEPIARASSCR